MLISLFQNEIGEELLHSLSDSELEEVENMTQRLFTIAQVSITITLVILNILLFNL